MIRLLLAVLISATLGSLAGTLICTLIEGGTGSTNPVRFVVGFATTTFMFTLPGAGLLMLVAWWLADRAVKPIPSAVIIVLVGSLAGAGMLSLFSAYFMALGALFGFLTAAIFVAMLYALRLAVSERQ